MWDRCNAIFRDMRSVCRVAYLNLTGHVKLDAPLQIGPTNSRKIPIILVHGSGSSQSDWLEGLSEIENHFPDRPIFAFSLSLPFDFTEEKQNQAPIGRFNIARLRLQNSSEQLRIEEYSQKLNDRIEYICQKCKSEAVVLIGHSMGGLLSLLCAVSRPLQVAAVVCISSPLQGAPLLKNPWVSRMLKTTRHRQMTPGSNFLQQLHRDLAASVALPPILTIGSKQDIHVPSHACTIQHDKITHVDVNGYGHFSITSAPRVWIEIQKWLDEIVKQKVAVPLLISK